MCPSVPTKPLPEAAASRVGCVAWDLGAGLSWAGRLPSQSWVLSLKPPPLSSSGEGRGVECQSPSARGVCLSRPFGGAALGMWNAVTGWSALGGRSPSPQ